MSKNEQKKKKKRNDPKPIEETCSDEEVFILEDWENENDCTHRNSISANCLQRQRTSGELVKTPNRITSALGNNKNTGINSSRSHRITNDDCDEEIFLIEETTTKKGKYDKFKMKKPTLDSIEELEEQFASRSLNKFISGSPSHENSEIDINLHLPDIEKSKDSAATVIQAYYRGYKTRKNSEMSVSRNLSASLPCTLQGDAALFIQYYFRKWKRNTLFQSIQIYRADRLQQLVFFSQQVHLFGQELQSKVQRHNQLLDLSQVHSEAAGAHRFLLNQPKPAAPKLSLDHTLNVFFDTSYLCDPSREKKGRIKDNDWEMPFKGRSPASSARTENMGVAHAISEETANQSQFKAPSITAAKAMFSHHAAPTSQDFKAPVLKPANRSSNMKKPIGPYQGLPSKKPASSVPIYNKHPVSSYMSGPQGNKSVVINTWESRTEQNDFRKKQISVAKEIAEKATDADEGSTINFRGMLRKTNYRRDSMKRVGNDNHSPCWSPTNLRSPSPGADNSHNYDQNHDNYNCNDESSGMPTNLVEETEEAML